jgi:hypothetical protein
MLLPPVVRGSNELPSSYTGHSQPRGEKSRSQQRLLQSDDMMVSSIDQGIQSARAAHATERDGWDRRASSRKPDLPVGQPLEQPTYLTRDPAIFVVEVHPQHHFSPHDSPRACPNLQGHFPAQLWVSRPGVEAEKIAPSFTRSVLSGPNSEGRPCQSSAIAGGLAGSERTAGTPVLERFNNVQQGTIGG